VAVESGLDPDKTAPEDILLLMRDKDGGLLVNEARERAAKRAQYYAGRIAAGLAGG
jgi:hypothetical protein